MLESAVLLGLSTFSILIALLLSCNLFYCWCKRDETYKSNNLTFLEFPPPTLAVSDDDGLVKILGSLECAEYDLAIPHSLVGCLTVYEPTDFFLDYLGADLTTLLLCFNG